MVPVGLFIQDDVNDCSQHLVLLPSLIMSSWNVPLQWARVFTFTLEDLILYLKMSKYISPRRAIGQVQKFAGRWIITGLEITIRKSIHAFSHSLIVLQISYYIINLSVSMLPFSSHFTTGQSQPEIYTQSPGIDLTGGHNLCGGASESVLYLAALLSCSWDAFIRLLLLTIHGMAVLKGTLEHTYFSSLSS